MRIFKVGFVIQVLLQNSYVVIETIFFGSIEDIKIVDLHVHGSIQFSDADISFIKKKLYLWQYSHYISHLHLPGWRQACDGII